MKNKKAIKITITGFIYKNEIGLAECELIDCKGKKWNFSGKPALFSKKEINKKTDFPQEGILPCKVEAQRLDSTGKLVALVNTIRWQVDSVESGGYFEVYDSQLIDL